jgi:hypothetical protein
MKMRGMLLFGGLLLAVSLSGYSRSNTADAKTTPFLQCQEPRPDICYGTFAPVCATINTPTIRQVTYTNDCKACADSRVQGFTPGECK